MYCGTGNNGPCDAAGSLSPRIGRRERCVTYLHPPIGAWDRLRHLFSRCDWSAWCGSGLREGAGLKYIVPREFYGLVLVLLILSVSLIFNSVFWLGLVCWSVVWWLETSISLQRIQEMVEPAISFSLSVNKDYYASLCFVSLSVLSVTRYLENVLVHKYVVEYQISVSKHRKDARW